MEMERMAIFVVVFGMVALVAHGGILDRCSPSESSTPTKGCVLVEMVPEPSDAPCGVYEAMNHYICPGDPTKQQCTRLYYKACPNHAISPCTDEQLAGYILKEVTMCKEIGCGKVYDIYQKRSTNENAADPEYIVCNPRDCCCARYPAVTGGNGEKGKCTDALIAYSKAAGWCYPGNSFP